MFVKRKTILLFKRAFVVFVVLLVFMQVLCINISFAGEMSDRASAEELFINIKRDHDLHAGQGREIDDPTIIRSRYVDINFKYLAGKAASQRAETILLNLFDDASFTAVRGRLERRSDNSYSWFGKIEGENISNVVLTVDGRVMFGRVEYSGSVYKIEPVGDGAIHRIIEPNMTKILPFNDDYLIPPYDLKQEWDVVVTSTDGQSATPKAGFTMKNDNIFTDVSESHWAYDYIMAIYNAGITNGCEGGSKYCPDRIVTRAEMAAFIIRALEGEPPDDYCGNDYPFEDIPPDHWACKYIKRLYELGITEGYKNGNYGPNDKVDRAQMAAFLARAFLGVSSNSTAALRVYFIPNSVLPYTGDDSCFDTPPEWEYTSYVEEINGVGVTISEFTGDFYDSNGNWISQQVDDADTFADWFDDCGTGSTYIEPYSTSCGESCGTLGGRTSGSVIMTFYGVDDYGNHISASDRVWLDTHSSQKSPPLENKIENGNPKVMSR